MTKRFLCQFFGLIVITAALAFSGCAWNGYTPISAPPSAGSGCGGGGSGFS